MFRIKTDIEKLTQNVESFKQKQDDAVGIIKGTVQKLYNVNDELIDEISSNTKKVNEITALTDALVSMKQQNEALIKNFSKLLEV